MHFIINCPPPHRKRLKNGHIIVDPERTIDVGCIVGGHILDVHTIMFIQIIRKFPNKTS